MRALALGPVQQGCAAPLGTCPHNLVLGLARATLQAAPLPQPLEAHSGGHIHCGEAARDGDARGEQPAPPRLADGCVLFPATSRRIATTTTAAAVHAQAPPRTSQRQ